MITLSNFILEAKSDRVKYLDKNGEPIKFSPGLPKRGVKINLREYSDSTSLFKAVIPFIGGNITKINTKKVPRKILFAYESDERVCLRVELPDGTDKRHRIIPKTPLVYSFKYGDVDSDVINKIKNLKPDESYEIIEKYADPDAWSLIIYLISIGIGVVSEDDSMKYISNRKHKTVDDAEYGFDVLFDYLKSSKNYRSAWIKDGVLWLYSGN